MSRSIVSTYLCKILILSSGIAFAQPINTSLPADTTGTVSSSIMIPIKVSDLTNRGVISYQAVISFNENVLDATGASSKGTLTGVFGAPTVNIINDGEIRVGSFGTSPLSGSGTLVHLMFNIVGLPGDTTSLRFKSFYFNSGDPATETKDGKLTVVFPTHIGNLTDPGEIFMLENYPNPFNPETSIQFVVPNPEFVTIQIFNTRAQLVRQIVHQFFTPGRYTVRWDGRNEAGNMVIGGLYLCKMQVENFVATTKMMLIK